MKMTYDDFEVGKYYWSNNCSCPWFCFNMKLLGKCLVCMGDGEAMLLAGDSLKDWQGECDRDGNLIAPEPKVGQIWLDSCGDECRINEVYLPNGDARYVAIDIHGDPTPDFEPRKYIQDLTQDMTYVRG